MIESVSISSSIRKEIDLNRLSLTNINMNKKNTSHACIPQRGRQFPLYRRLVNIKEPSMVVMGLVRRACHVIALDAQTRYTTALIKGDFTLPSKVHMLDVWQKEVDVINSNGRPMSDLHLLGDKEDEYYKELSDESGIDRVPRIMSKLRAISNETKLDNVFTYHEYIYQVIDSKTFSRTERVTKRERLAGRTAETVVFVADDEL